MPTKKGAPTTKAMPSFVRKGKDVISERSEGGSQFVALPANESVVIVPMTGLDEMISYDQHQIWLKAGNSPKFPCSQQDDCPGCMIGDKPRTRGLLNVAMKNPETEEMEVKVWGFGMQVMRILADVEESLDSGDLSGKVLKVKKTGSQLTTKYSVIPTGNQAKSMPDESQIIELLPLVGETDRDKIIVMLKEAGVWKKPGAAAANDEVEDEVDDEIDDEIVEDGEEGDDGDWA